MVGGADLESIGGEEIIDEETKPLIQTVRKKQENLRILSLIVLCFSSFMGGCSLSILSPFYSKEAEDHGLSVTASGTVFASVFVLQIIFTPIFGKFLKNIGTVRLFVVGVFIVGFSNIMFGLLEVIQSGPGFLAASLTLRSVMAIGEAGMNTAVYPLARSMSKEGSESSVIGWIEMMLGLGCTIGPFIGGLLFEYGGFYLPFLVCGNLILVAGLFASLILSCGEVKPDISITTSTTTYRSLIKKPGMLTVCLATVSTGVSTQWYQASLEPYVRQTFGMSPFQASLLFIIDGGVYALISPIVGIFLDRGLNHRFSLGIGCATISLGYFVLASPFMSASLLQVGFGLGIHGVGMGVSYLTTFTMMSSIAGDEGQDDEDKVQGLVTAIWFICESIGGILGASIGGVAFDSLGWYNSSFAASVLQALCLLQVIISCSYSKFQIQKRKMDPGRTNLLSEDKKNYGTVNNNTI